MGGPRASMALTLDPNAMEREAVRWLRPALTLGRRRPRCRAGRCGPAKFRPGTPGTPPDITWLGDGGSGLGASPGPESRGPLVDRLVVTAAYIRRTSAA